MPAYALEPHSRLDERSAWMADGVPPERRVPSAPGWRDAAGRWVEAAEDPDAAAAEVADFQLHVMSVLLQKGPWRLQQRQADAEALGRRVLARWRQLEAGFALRRLHEHRQKRAISRLGKQALQPNRRLRMRAVLETLHRHAATALRTEPSVTRLRRRLRLRRGVAQLLAEAARARARSLLDAPAAPLERISPQFVLPAAAAGPVHEQRSLALRLLGARRREGGECSSVAHAAVH